MEHLTLAWCNWTGLGEPFLGKTKRTDISSMLLKLKKKGTIFDFDWVEMKQKLFLCIIKKHGSANKWFRFVIYSSEYFENGWSCFALEASSEGFFSLSFVFFLCVCV